MPAMTMNSLLELFYQHEKHTGRRPASVSLTPDQYDDLRLDPDTPRHLVFTNYGKTASLAGVRIDIDNRAAHAPEAVKFNVTLNTGPKILKPTFLNPGVSVFD